MLARLFLLFALLGAPASAAPLFGTKWGSPVWGTGATISYSFATPGAIVDDGNYGNQPGPHLSYDGFLPDGHRAAVADAFAVWAGVADLRFVEVDDSGTPFNTSGGGDIRFWGVRADPAYVAWGYYPHADPAGGDIFMNAAVDFALGDDVEGLRFDWVVLHEIGHALGLMHDDADPSSAMYAFYPVGEGRLNATDIASVRHLYGPARVPTPASAALLGAGLLLLVAARRHGRPDGR